MEAGFLRLYRAKEHQEWRDYSHATFQQLLAAGSDDSFEFALEELTKRGEANIATELVRAYSKDLLNTVLRMKWVKKGEKETLVLDQQISDDKRANLLEISYMLSPSVRAICEVMIDVVSERLSSADVGKRSELSTHPAASNLALSALPPTSTRRTPALEPPTAKQNKQRTL